MIDSVSAAPIHPIQSAAAAAKSVNQTLDGSFRQFYNQALQQSNQMPLPFNIPNGVNPINMQTNGLVAAIAQNFTDTIVDKRKITGLNESAHMSSHVMSNKKSASDEGSLYGKLDRPLLAQAELPDDFYNQQDPLNLFDQSFEGSISPDGVPVVSGYSNNKLEITPFQFFIDKAVDFFLRVSAMERNTDLLMERYVQGRASLEELMIEKAKTSVAVTFCVTLVTQVSQTFKEIQNMQV